jgi:hypothetical protein
MSMDKGLKKIMNFYLKPFQIVWIESCLKHHAEVYEVAKVNHVKLRLDSSILKVPLIRELKESWHASFSLKRKRYNHRKQRFWNTRHSP